MHTYGDCLLSMPSPTSLPLLTCLALSPSHTSPDGSPSSAALLVPSLPLTLPPPPPTLPSGVLSCLKRNTSWLCMKPKREREIKGNCGDNALQTALASQVFSAGRPVTSAGHCPGMGAAPERDKRTESGQRDAGGKGTKFQILTAPSAAAALGYR